MTARPLVVGLGSLILAGIIGGSAALALSPSSTPAPKVALVQRSDATTPTTVAPVTTTTAPATATTLPAGTDPVVAANSAAGSANSAAQSAALAAGSASQAQSSANQATATTVPVPTPTTTMPVEYCRGSLAADEAAPPLPVGWASNGNGECVDAFGTFWNAGGSQYNTTANGDAGRATYRVGS
jgi:hypothetical protein